MSKSTSDSSARLAARGGITKQTRSRKPASTADQAHLDTEERQRMIAEAAYFRAEQRGFAGGDPLSDWLAAEAEVDARLTKDGNSS